ncbi:MAG TPA: hypothetical protein PLC48_04885 [Ferruginibacter sp.]|nr:hypothetical protein [Ferruginibacter sp.]
MKTQSNTLLAELSKTQVENLTNQVKETLAIGYNAGAKTFSSADLWNIQKQRRTFLSRRSF